MALLAPGAISAQTLSPSDDAHISTTFPSVNFGSMTLLHAGATAGDGPTQVFIRFSLDSLPPGTNVTSISKVNLVLFVNRLATAGSVQVFPVTSDWTEA